MRYDSIRITAKKLFGNGMVIETRDEVTGDLLDRDFATVEQVVERRNSICEKWAERATVVVSEPIRFE